MTLTGKKGKKKENNEKQKSWEARKEELLRERHVGMRESGGKKRRCLK